MGDLFGAVEGLAQAVIRRAQDMPRKPTFRWRPFLKQVSRDLLKDVSIREDLPKEVIDSGWLGFEGASEKEIAGLEQQLGKPLPPSYRTFLAETNGWRDCGPFIYKLWPCSEVHWFRERHQDWIDAYVHPENNGIQVVYPPGQPPPQSPPLTDDEYLVYGEEQDSCRFRTEYLQSALEISDVGDSAILLLNPEIINDEGEWEAWLFANWMPGAHRYRSFRELMEGEHQSYRRLRKELGPTKSKYGNAAQQAARRGETATALAQLRQLAAAGDQSSAVSLAELCAFLGLWDEVLANLGKAILNLDAIPNFEGYPGHLIRLLIRAGHETAHWARISEVAADAIAAQEKRGQEGYTAWFKNLQKYCEKRSGPPHDVTIIHAFTDPIDQLSESERRSQFQRVEQDEYNMRLKKKPHEYARHQLALARNMKLDDEVIRIYEEFPEAIYFDGALDVSRAYMRRGDEETAWSVFRDRMNQSVGGLPEQVAPIILLIDETLRPLMTRERCEFVLSTPRGPEAMKRG